MAQYRMLGKTDPLTALQAKDSSPVPPSQILKPPSWSDACSPLKVWHRCLWPSDLWRSDCQAHALQRASRRKPALSLAKSVDSRTTGKMNATILWISLRGKDLFFAIGFCSGKGIFSASWSMCLLHFIASSTSISLLPDLHFIVQAGKPQVQSPTGYMYPVIRMRSGRASTSAVYIAVVPLIHSLWPCEFYIACLKPGLSRKPVEWSYHCLSSSLKARALFWERQAVVQFSAG